MIVRFVFLAALLASTSCSAQGTQKVPRNAPESTIKNVPATTGRANLRETPPPFTIQKIGNFDEPFAMAFLHEGKVLVTEKGGRLKLRNGNGAITDVAGVPKVATGGQGGLLDVAPSPDFMQGKATIYLTYSEAGPGGSVLTLAKAELDIEDECVAAPCPVHSAMLRNVKVIWRSGSSGPGGQFGANITFAPDGKSLFLSSGERQRFTPAQDPEQRLGKILRLTLDGKAWQGDTYREGDPRAETWSTGHRNPYGMVFTPDGRLWEEEMGPRGGDELNLILPGKNYGWPIVSNGDNYSGKPIPDHPSRPDLEAPKLWWNPSISPGGMIAYSGTMFPQYKGNLFIAALGGQALIRIAINGDTAKAVEQWSIGARVRDVAQAPDGAIWLIYDEGDLVRLTPKR